jgi:hypothetical protein
MTKLEPKVIRIDPRFCGPPDSGNGGYVCGRLAGYLDGEAVTVRLRVPPPLERKLDVRRSETGASLLDGDVVVAEARASIMDLKPPDPSSYAEAEAASSRFRGFDSHWFPCCFVCGPDRVAGEGLRIFAGPIEGRDGVAAPWIPDATLAPSGGRVAPEFLWAALDCPGAFAVPEPETGGILLGELQVALFGDVFAGERCVLLGWEIAHEGRKHTTGTALYGESGACRGLGRGTWIEVATAK